MCLRCYSSDLDGDVFRRTRFRWNVRQHKMCNNEREHLLCFEQGKSVVLQTFSDTHSYCQFHFVDSDETGSTDEGEQLVELSGHSYVEYERNSSNLLVEFQDYESHCKTGFRRLHYIHKIKVLVHHIQMYLLYNNFLDAKNFNITKYY